MGAGALPFNQDDRIRWGPAVAYLTPEVRSRPNLEIRPRTVARCIEVEGARATAVLVEGPGGAGRVAAGEVILSAGAIATPQLLLLSGIGPADELARHGIACVADRPGVGRNLRDHPKAWVEWRLLDDVVIADPAPGLQTSVRYTATGSPNRGDMMLYPNSVVATADGGRDFRLEVVDNLELSSGTIRLRSADPDVLHAIDLGFLAEPVDRERLADGIRRAIELGATRPLDGLLGERILPADDVLASRASLGAWLEHGVMTGHHVSSTARMGRADDPGAVVDASGRVHGIDRLRIVDASIMPDSVRANIHATVIALAEIMAQRVRTGA
jgi:choline dehydrogenase